MLIMVPCYPVKKQIEAKVFLLREIELTGNRVGMEFLLKMDDLDNPSLLKEFERNIKILPKDIELSLHAPFDIREGSKRNFFVSDKGYENLRKTMQFAKNINAKLVNIHAHLFLTYQEIKEMGTEDISDFKKDSIQKTKEGLTRIRREKAFSDIDICVENVPYCLTTDRFLDPRKALYELCFVEPRDFLEIASEENSIFATIDVCHLAEVYDSSELLAEMREIGKSIKHIHFSDLASIWQPFICLVKEGEVLGEGRIGERILKEILSYLLAELPEVSLVLEIDDKDFIKLEESRRSSKILLKWLEEIERG